jgi:NAD-dependent SIR2 family protein deacetylase
MVAMRRQSIISLSDMRYVSIQCKQCGASITLDMMRVSDYQKRFGFAPTACSACQLPHDTSVKNLDGLRLAYESLLGISDRITFHGDPENAESSDSASRASSDKG